MWFMRKLLSAVILFSVSSGIYAWDFSLKADAQKEHTDNVNFTSTNPIADNITSYGGYLQTKNDTFKIKLKGKVEKYQNQNVNDNYATDLSLQYKRTKDNSFTFSVFKQVYNGVSLLNTDTTSDNSGGRLSTTITKQFDKDTSGYITLTGTYKKYPKIIGRTDKIAEGTFGLEHYFNNTFMINPELNLQSDKSADAYYSNFSYGPSIFVDITPNDTWEIFFDASYSYTRYSGRPVTITVNRRTTTEDEHQTLVSYDAGLIFNLTKALSLQAKYQTGKNTSNNNGTNRAGTTATTSPVYKVNVTSFNIACKF